MSTSLTPTGFTAAPVVPQADGTGQIVGLNLQNTGSTVLAAQPTSFGETFMAGAVQPGDTLTATIGGQVYAVQMDAKTFNPDGSVAMAVLTVDAPALPPDSTTGAMISVGGTPAGIASPGADLASALNGYTLTATLAVTANAGGTTGTQQVNIGAAVAAALANGTATMWLNGSLAQEAIVSIPVTGSLRIEADVTAYANGKISADLQFNNDIAMSNAGGTITYSTTITQNGVVVSSQPSLTQYQYQDWSTTVGTAPAAGALNIQENIPYLEATGAVQNYDTQYGIGSGQISSEAAAIAAPGWNAPLGTDGITQYMPGPGGRGDIGPTTQSNADWLISQNATAAAYALGQAQEAGSVPWHFYDPTTNGAFLNTADSPGIWTDPRGNPGLTQVVSSSTGWQTDPAHMPDLSFDAYLQTGNVQYLEQLNAQASFAETDAYPPSNTRNDGQGLVVHGQQIRASAWALRELQEAAYANPAGSADKAYFTQMVNTNYSWLVSMIPTWTLEEGQAHGYLPGSYGTSGVLPPWQEDYFASSVIQGAEMGIQDAVTYLAWSSNFYVGRFFADAEGFNPKDAIVYNLTVVTGTNHGLNSGAPFYTTWAAIEQANEAAGDSNVAGSGMGSGWGQSQGDYGALALQTLAGVITVSTMNAANAATMGVYQYQAMQAFGWLLASGAPYISPNSTASTTPQFSIDPRLANGQLLSFGNVTISTDTTPTVLSPVDSTENALIYAGSGADTLVGGKGINLLFGGSGSDVIFGGPNGNDIFAGSGNETIVAGGGANYIQASSTALLTAGTGQDLFVIDTQASGTVTISGFNAALDRLDLVDASGGALSSLVSTVVGGAQTVAGGVVLKVSPTETVTIETVNGATVSAAWFDEQAQALGTVTGATSSIGGSGSTTGAGAPSVGGGSVPPVVTSPVVTSIAGGGFIAGDVSVGGSGSIEGGSGAATVTVGASGVTSIVGGGGAITVTGGAGSFQFLGGAGAAFINLQGTAGDGNVITGTGNTTINSGTGHDYIDISNASTTGSVVINGYSFVNNPINYLGFANNDYLRSAAFNASGGVLTLVDGQVIQLNYAEASTASGSVASQPSGTSIQVVTLDQSGQAYTGGAGPVILDDESGFNTITGGSGGLNLTDDKGHDLISTAANSKNVLNLASADTVQSTGADMITMAGGGVVSAAGGTLSFVGGTSTSTIFGGAGAMSLASGSGGLDVAAGSGAVSLVQGSGADQITAGGGNMTIGGGTGTLNFTDGGGTTLIDQVSGNGIINFRGGNVTIDQGSAADVLGFSSVNGGGSLTINNFNPMASNFNYGGLNVVGCSFGPTVDQLTLSDGTKITMNLAK
ncbi:beta strand repeat-containing protein [Acidiphilium acidophilum]|uniref:Calcium-binding protein n=1 Tax=Acidiphilium acidophilum TaxID=76588 RepID=A0AAW9DLS3_ACIAO|nr:calcium-binding protein [Acidiphilium acidophilum]MDX5930104.1 calcium-binding protein [Acidiphilium acidophilum]